MLLLETGKNFFFFNKTATQTKTAKENHRLHDKKHAEQSGLRAMQCQTGKEGWLSLQLGNHNMRHDLSRLM